MANKSTTAFLAVSAALAALSACAAIFIIVQKGLDADGAAWIQAAGSIAAITGAVWLWRSESIQRRRERRAIGEEVAWSVRFALTNAQLEAWTIAAELVDEHLLEKNNPGRHWLLRTENTRNVLRIFSERTDHIHPAVNHVASNGMLLLKQMDGDIALALEYVSRGERPSINAATDIAWYEAHFEELIQLLDARMRSVLKALDENDDSLPARSLGAWQPPREGA